MNLSQEQWIVLVLKAGLVLGFVSIVTWIVVYHRLSHGNWWRNPIGRTLVVHAAVIAMLFVPTGLSLFLHFNRLTSHVAGWIQAALICAVTPIMIWRTVVWLRESRE